MYNLVPSCHPLFKLSWLCAKIVYNIHIFITLYPHSLMLRFNLTPIYHQEKEKTPPATTTKHILRCLTINTNNYNNRPRAHHKQKLSYRVSPLKKTYFVNFVSFKFYTLTYIHTKHTPQSSTPPPSLFLLLLTVYIYLVFASLLRVVVYSNSH